MTTITRTALVATVLAVALAACGDDTPAAGSDALAPSCPVTIPAEGFTPPDGYPVEPSTADLGDLWYGDDQLWTVLPTSGPYRIRKSVWWSTAFPGGTVEEQPPISVVWTALGTGATQSQQIGTNAYTSQDGWFMIAGIDPDEPGCWRVEATYKGATLSYVYEID